MTTEVTIPLFLAEMSGQNILCVCMFTFIDYFLKPFRYTSAFKKATNEIFQVQVSQSRSTNILEGALQKVYFIVGR